MLLALLFVLMNVEVASSDAAGNNRFGRWETTVSSCRITHAERSMGCRQLQLTQTSWIGLRIRLIGENPEGPNRTHQLTFVTEPGSGDPVLSCQNGRCNLAATSWNGTISSRSLVFFDERGLPIGLPGNRPTQGRCTFSEGRLSCQSQTRDGLNLSVEAQL